MTREILDFLQTRRSVVVRNLTEPGPDDAELEEILRAAIRVPDHGRLAPWRFVVIRGENRTRFGKILGEAFRKANDDAFDELVEVEEERFERAPVVVAVISRVVKEHKIPEWEQILSSGAACQNMLNAAHASGFAAQWITEWPAYDRNVQKALGLAENDRIAGFVYIGSAKEPPEERKRAELADVVSEWTPPGE